MVFSVPRAVARASSPRILLIGFVAMAIALTTACGSSGSSSITEQAAAEPALPPVEASPHAEGSPPETILFRGSYGDVEFTHIGHIQREQGNCATCHPSVFPQALEPLDYGKARHRSAEEYKTSCATCHGISGTAFTSERNCERCHDVSRGQRKSAGVVNQADPLALIAAFRN